jgi:hypothetical protein
MAAVLILQLQPGLLNLTMRRTDVFVHEQLRLTPLSVSADRIAHVAFRCAVLLAKLDAADAPVDRSRSGPVAEVYPAASLHSWSLDDCSAGLITARRTAQLRLWVDGADLAGMEMSRVVALRGPCWLALVPPAALPGLASERRAGLPGPRRGVAQKRRERHVGPGIGRARHGLCPPEGKERFDGGSGDRG